MKDLAAPDVFATIARFHLCRTAQEVGTLLVAAVVPFGLSHYAIGGMPTPAGSDSYVCRNLTPGSAQVLQGAAQAFPGRTPLTDDRLRAAKATRNNFSAPQPRHPCAARSRGFAPQG